MNPTQLVKTLDTIIDRLDNIEQRLAAIERAATCGTGPNEPVSFSPAQADVGEASAESEWPRYYKCATGKTFHLGHALVKWNGRDDRPLMCCHPSEPDKTWCSAGLADTFAVWIREGKWIEVPRAEAETRIAAARGEKPRLDDAFPIPATVEQGPTAGMKKAANMLGYHDDHHQYPQISRVLEVLQKHIGPELAAKDAEIERLRKSIGTWQTESTRHRQEAKRMAQQLTTRTQELSAATAANVERDRDHEVMEWWRKHPRPIATFGHKWYCEPIGDDLRHLCDDPATAILAAKTAGGE